MRVGRSLLFSLFFLAGCPSTPEPTDGGGSPDATRGCSVDADCDDGLFCNGEEVCDAGSCVPGRAPSCHDDIACTLDTCNEDRARCENRAPDEDRDGYGDRSCEGPAGPLGNDCDDADPTRFPGNLEVCDEAGLDEDCDETTLGGRDVDGDGFVAAICCNPGETAAVCGTDCNDTQDGAHPGAVEVCNGVDDDCNGSIDEGVRTALYVDADRDGYGAGPPVMSCVGLSGFVTDDGDCDDDDIARNPGQPEFCDGVDNDCNTAIDDGTRAVDWFLDDDGDGFGTPSVVVSACAPVSGHSLRSTDCDDADPGRSPRTVETCNGRDDDCDGRANGAVGPGDFEDDDSDGLADLACGGTDCDDTDPESGGSAAEICDGRDNDCDDRIDESVRTIVYYRDADGDGYGSSTSGTVVSCVRPLGHVETGGDCDDRDAARTPGGSEWCDGVDEDCDGAVDEEPASLFACSKLPGADSGYCAAGRCTPRNCIEGRGDCDGIPENGCEASLLTSVSDCGGCGVSCGSGSHATGFCNDGACDLFCDSGFHDCNGDASDGCETSGVSCPSCTATCGGACTDLDEDEANCGACGVSCGAGGTCIAGRCDRFVDIAASMVGTCGVREGGGVACWGGNALGENGTSSPGPGAVTVTTTAPAIAIVSGDHFSCALLETGDAECWGDNSLGQLGDGTTSAFAPGTHAIVDTLDPMRSLAAGAGHVIGYANANRYFGWGDDRSGQITGTPNAAPMAAASLGWGMGAGSGMLLLGDTFTCRLSGLLPSCVGVLTGYGSGMWSLSAPSLPIGSALLGGAATGDGVCVHLGSGNGVWCAGAGTRGELGFPSPPDLVRSSFGSSLSCYGSSASVMCMVSSLGSIHCAGDNAYGQLGTGSAAASSNTPVLIVTPTRVQALTHGPNADHLCGIDLAGRVWCWGRNDVGQVTGAATVPPVRTPTLVPGL